MTTTMTTTDEALALAKRMFTFYVLGDTSGLTDLFSPDVVGYLPGDPAILPWAGTFQGLAGVEQFHRSVKDAVDVLDYTVLAYKALGDTVVAECFEHVRVKATGKIFENKHAGVVTVRDGRIVSYVEYSDTAAMQAAFLE
jgi:ketosteroid isomerase-like protein